MGPEGISKRLCSRCREQREKTCLSKVIQLNTQEEEPLVMSRGEAHHTIYCSHYHNRIEYFFEAEFVVELAACKSGDGLDDCSDTTGPS